MPEVLPEIDTFPDTVSVPKNGDKRNAESVRAAIRPLTYRTRKHENDILAMGTRAGVTRIREAATKTALLALAGVVSGDWAYLLGVGLYRFTTGAVAGGAEPMVFEAPAQGGGRWVNAALNHDAVVQGGPVWANAAGLASVKGLSADVVIAKALGVSGPIAKTSGGYTKERVVLGPDADATYSPDEVDVVTTYGVTSDRVYTLTADPAKHHGAIIRIAVPKSVAAEIAVFDGNNGVKIADLGNVGVLSPGYHFGTFLFSNWSTPAWARIA